MVKESIAPQVGCVSKGDRSERVGGRREWERGTEGERYKRIGREVEVGERKEGEDEGERIAVTDVL